MITEIIIGLISVVCFFAAKWITNEFIKAFKMIAKNQQDIYDKLIEISEQLKEQRNERVI